MKTALFVVLGFSISLMSFDEGNQMQPDSEPVSCEILHRPYGDGESLGFKVYYNYGALWVGAGELQFDVREEENGTEKLWHVTSKAKTFPAYDRIFKVRDTYETWIDGETLLPARFHRDVKEGGYAFQRKYEFDRENRKVDAVYQKDGKYREHVLEDLPGCVQDLLSSMYYLRSVDVTGYKAGDRIPISIIVDGKPQELSVLFEGLERKKTRLGIFDCIVFKPQLLKGDYFKDEDGLTVWLSNDLNRVPIRAEAAILIGSLKADLRTHEGLSHMFSAKIK